MNYTEETYFLDFNNPKIKGITSQFINISSKTELIESLYIYVRDNWRYSPFNIGLKKEHFKASNIADKKDGHCIDKAIVYITCLRAFNIPARLHLAKVSNHIATERLEKIIGTNQLAPHGLVDVFHNNKWVKCSPAFNKELCKLYNVDTLEFNGTKDSVLQEFNKSNDKFMSYLEDYGAFEDVPLDFIKETFKSNYPNFYDKYKNLDQIII